MKYGRRLYRIRGSACEYPQQAALHVVAWYRERFGDQWKEAASRRALRPRAVRVWQDSTGGWRACVWEFGRRMEVSGVRKAGHAHAVVDEAGNCHLRQRDWRTFGRALVFGSRAEAEAAVEVWLKTRWGALAGAAVWRTGSP